jgi:hypothetical protein
MTGLDAGFAGIITLCRYIALTRTRVTPIDREPLNIPASQQDFDVSHHPVTADALACQRPQCRPTIVVVRRTMAAVVVSC